MRYADGYLLPVPKKNIKAYLKMAKAASKVWMDHGAVQYCESIGEDMAAPWGVPFPKQMKAAKTETVVFAWVVYKSRKHRDQVNAAVMKDPRLAKMCDPKKMPFDCKRMVYGGFEIRVEG